MAGSRQSSSTQATWPVLTQRQAQVLDLVAVGLSNREIGVRLEITEDGVKGHIRRLLDKYDVPNRTALVHAVAQSSHQVSLHELLQPIMETLAETIGNSATRNIVRRAMRHAEQRNPDFPALPPLGAGAAPHGWLDVQGEEALRTVSAITRELWPLLVAASGEVLIRDLEHRGLSGTGILDNDEVTA